MSNLSPSQPKGLSRSNLQSPYPGETGGAPKVAFLRSIRLQISLVLVCGGSLLFTSCETDFGDVAEEGWNNTWMAQDGAATTGDFKGGRQKNIFDAF